MVQIEFTSEQLDELYKEATENLSVRNRRKCWVLHLKGQGLAHNVIAKVMRLDDDTITRYVTLYRDGGLPRLLAEHYRKPEGQLEAYTQQLKELFQTQPPHTVNHAIELIAQETGVSLKPSACRAFMRNLGLKFLRCGLTPGKTATDPEQRQKQQEYHDNKLQPRLEEAKQGQRVVLFVDGAHFVMGAFLGMLWCFVRHLLPSSSGRQRYNVLGAYDPIRSKVITMTNDTVINQGTFVLLLEQIATEYAGTGCPITLFLDNARYQKCSLVFEKAEELGIELMYLPAYSPNLNLIERLWRFVKKQVLYSKHYEKFSTFKDSIDTCLRDLGTRFKSNMQTLMTLKFQLL